jgi:hypothetical protein
LIRLLPALHAGELGAPIICEGLGGLRHVQREHVGLLQHRRPGRGGTGVPQRQLGHDVVEDDPHPQRLREQAHLGADVP